MSPVLVEFQRLQFFFFYLEFFFLFKKFGVFSVLLTTVALINSPAFNKLVFMNSSFHTSRRAGGTEFEHMGLARTFCFAEL